MTFPASRTDVQRPAAGDGEPDASVQSMQNTPGGSAPATPSGGTNHRRNDKIFKFITTGSAATISVIIVLIGLFLLWRAVPALNSNVGGIGGFFSYTGTWDTNDTSAMKFGIPNLFAVTVLVSVIALAMAMPVALGVAIFLSSYCPKRLVRPIGFLVDLLAAVPSIVYGLWGAAVLGPTMGPIYEWMSVHLAFIPLFAEPDNAPPFSTSRNLMTGSIVLAIMILPIIASTAREVFVQTPTGHIESALALGATRWEVVKMTVLPFGLSGFISGSMLGLGRALGETMALYLVIASSAEFSFSLFDGGTTFATAIAYAAPEFNNNLKAGAYISAGLVLFILTFVVNAAARSIVARRQK